MERNNDNAGIQNEITTTMMTTNKPTSNEKSAENCNKKTKTERNADGDCTIINLDNNDDNKKDGDDVGINEIAAQLESIGPKNENPTHLFSKVSSPFNCNENINSINSNSNNNAFETNVKQISKNLTTLADTLPKEIATMATTLPIIETAMPSESKDQDANINNETDDLPNDTSLDDTDGHSKKVRFHPDVKENDDGNRVMLKKKKKLKGVAYGKDDGKVSPTTSLLGDEMDVDEDDEVDEEEFDLAKTSTEAQDYLKTHPLMVSYAYDNKESSEDEDPFENVQPEFGVVRILGKHVRGGSVEFLLRYVDRPGIFWETQETLIKKCPNLLNIYEQYRKSRQTRLMRHVAKRQNFRQHYTDF